MQSYEVRFDVFGEMSLKAALGDKSIGVTFKTVCVFDAERDEDAKNIAYPWVIVNRSWLRATHNMSVTLYRNDEIIREIGVPSPA